jgi:hypothetical protein
VVGPVTRGDLRVFPKGGGAPIVSTLNWEANILALANAAVVPLGSGGAITVHVDGTGTIDLVIDVNGYYASAPANQSNYFLVQDNVNGPTIEGISQWPTSGIGVYGVANGDLTSAGVKGFSTAGMGVEGLSTNNSALYGLSTNLDGINASGGRHGGYFGGRVYGAIGQTAGILDSYAGVRGDDDVGAADAGCCFSAGVRGLGQNGVVGISDTAYPAAGVAGVFTNSSGGATIHYGLIGTSSYGVYSAGDFGGTGAKYFVEPHPTDASQVIRYIALEGAESGTYFRGTAKTVHGEAIIEVPDDFRMVTDEAGLTVQLTPVQAFAQMYVESEDLNRIVVRSSRDVTFHYHVNGIRRAFKDFKAVTPGNEFMPRSPNETVPSYLTEEAKRRLIANGTYNADGTVNTNTAERVGWTKIWKERKAAAQAAAEARRQAQMATETKGQTAK